jgi:hypothetical protein
MKPCLIIGNGPSFNDIPASVLESMPSFGMNYCGFQPTYYVCVDSDILTHHFDEILPLANGAQVAYLSGLATGILTRKIPNSQLVYKDTASFRAEQFMSGFSAAYVCLKEAYYLGFSECHLWGIDFNPEWTHYRGDYRIGVKTTRARMDVMKWHFQLAQNVFTRAGRKIINHSHASELDAIFARAR